MDDLDRLFRHLVFLLADHDPDRLHAPIEVAELYQTIVPYRQHRVALKLESNQDYEMAVLRLLSGERAYASVEPAEAQQMLREEAASPNPDLGLFREFAAARVRLDPDAVRTALGARGAFVPPPPVPETPPPGTEPPPPPVPAPRRADPQPNVTDRPAGTPVPRRSEDDAAEVEGAGCPYCGQELPKERVVFYCPHCGGNVKGMECPKCRTGLEVGWTFCITCGYRMGRS